MSRMHNSDGRDQEILVDHWVLIIGCCIDLNIRRGQSVAGHFSFTITYFT